MSVGPSALEPDLAGSNPSTFLHRSFGTGLPEQRGRAEAVQGPDRVSITHLRRSADWQEDNLLSVGEALQLGGLSGEAVRLRRETNFDARSEFSWTG